MVAENLFHSKSSRLVLMNFFESKNGNVGKNIAKFGRGTGGFGVGKIHISKTHVMFFVFLRGCWAGIFLLKYVPMVLDIALGTSKSAQNKLMDCMLSNFQLTLSFNFV